MRQIILFGAGKYGRAALNYFGRENIFCFSDNNKLIEGQRVLDVPVISFERLREIHGDYDIVISTGAEVLFAIAAQLEEAGIHNYRSFLKILEGEGHSEFAPKPEQAAFHEPPDDCRQVLMAAYYFPPLSGSGVFRSIKFAKYLPQFNWWPAVISTDRAPLEMNYMDESLLEEIPAGMNVIRIPDPVYTMRMTSFPTETGTALIDFLKAVLQSDPEAIEMAGSLSQTKVGRAKLLTFPCPALLWAYEAIRYIEKHINLSKFQVIYTTSSPYSAHLIGFYLKQKYGIPWVADYRDPWTDVSQKELGFISSNDRLLVRLEEILLKAADCNISVERHFALSYVKRFSISVEKSITITNGYDENDFSGLLEPERHPPKFTITHSGLIHVKPQVTAFAAFLEALHQLIDEQKIDLANIQLRMIGKMTGESRAVLRNYDWGDALVETGYLSHQEALAENYDSNILLLPGGDADSIKFAYTGKFFDYLRSGRPILAVVARDSVIAQALRENGHGAAFLSTQLLEIKQFILREYQIWQRGGKRELLHSPLIEQFERKSLTGQLAEVFETIAR